MNNLRLTVFDTFSYLIPGTCYLILIPWGLGWLDAFKIIELISALTVYSIIAYSFLSYLIGFISDAISSVVVVKIADALRGDHRLRVLGEFKRENPESTITTYHFATIYSFVDVKASNARQKADMFSAMSGLARNLSLAFLIFGLLVAFRTIYFFSSTDLYYGIAKTALSLLIAGVLVYRADTFRRWSHAHLLNAYSVLSTTTDVDETKAHGA